MGHVSQPRVVSWFWFQFCPYGWRLNKVRAPGLQFVREQSAVFGVFVFFLGPVTSLVVFLKLGSECALTMQTLVVIAGFVRREKP